MAFLNLLDNFIIQQIIHLFNSSKGLPLQKKIKGLVVKKVKKYAHYFFLVKVCILKIGMVY